MARSEEADTAMKMLTKRVVEGRVIEVGRISYDTKFYFYCFFR